MARASNPTGGVSDEATPDPSTVPGTAKTILSTPVGYAFDSGVEGIDVITEHGVRVPKDKIDAVVAAAGRTPYGENFITVTTDEG